MLLHKGFRQWLRNGINDVENLTHAGVDIPALQFRPGRINGEEIPFEGRHVEFAGLILGGRCDGFQRLRSTEPARRRVQNQIPGMGELHGAPVEAHFTGEHQSGSLHQLILEKFGVEEGRGHLRPPVHQRDDKILAASAAAGPADVGALDLTDEGDVIAGFGWVVVLPQHLAALAVLTRIVAQQIVDGSDTEEFVKCLRRFVAEDPIEPIGQGHHGYSTPTSRTSPR